MKRLSEVIDLLGHILKEDGDSLTDVTVVSHYSPLPLEIGLDIFVDPFDKPIKSKPSKWHRVEDELPENSRMVLIFSTQHQGVTIGYYSSCNHWYFYDKDIVKNSVTHWRELPKPPKKASTE
jgi:hypothetical protein